MLGIGLKFLKWGEVVGLVVVVSDVGRCLGWRGRCCASDPTAVMASTLEQNWLVASSSRSLARLPVGCEATDLAVPPAAGKLFVGPEGHAVCSRRCS